jgi:hypothetical protein
MNQLTAEVGAADASVAIQIQPNPTSATRPTIRGTSGLCLRVTLLIYGLPRLSTTRSRIRNPLLLIQPEALTCCSTNERTQIMSTPEDRDRDDRTAAYDRNAGPQTHGAVAAESQKSHREDVIAREKERFGGMKFGSAFFGWLTAMGLTVILTALIAAIVVAVSGGVEDAAENTLSSQLGGVLIYAIVVLVVLFISYYCGGYVAGRMARFSGAKQGIAVWIWAIVIAIVVAILGAIAGSQFNILADLNTFPRIPSGADELTAEGIITAILALVVALGGAILGGLAGMRFHRRVDRAGLGR